MESDGKTALIIVDMQNDFISGSLAVGQGADLVAPINALRERPCFDVIVRSRDWHPTDHVSFAENHPGKELFTKIVVDETGRDQMMWPVHCVQGSDGAKYHEDLVCKDSDIEVLKGQVKMVESYSAFGGDGENTKLTETLRAAGVTKVYSCGLAFDYCVGSTAESAAQLGFQSFLITDMTKSVSPATEEPMQARLAKAGVQFVTSSELPA